LLHAALREVLGEHVQQRGSLVSDQYLRFDFSHFTKMSAEEISQVESIVNKKIRENIQRKEDRNIPIKVAEQSGARMLFGEKYGERVRMITFDPAFSIELCGGCHVEGTGSIGYFKITGESAVAAGVRRIEAITAGAAETYINEQLKQLSQIKQELKNPVDPVRSIRDLQDDLKQLRQQIEDMEIEKASNLKSIVLSQVEHVNGIKFIHSEVDIQDPKLLKSFTFQLGQELGEKTFIVSGSKGENKAQLMVYISEDLVKDGKLHAGKIVKDLAVFINGGGGGQPFFASAGGTNPDGLSTALQKAKDYIEH